MRRLLPLLAILAAPPARADCTPAAPEAVAAAERAASDAERKADQAESVSVRSGNPGAAARADQARREAVSARRKAAGPHQCPASIAYDATALFDQLSPLRSCRLRACRNDEIKKMSVRSPRALLSLQEDCNRTGPRHLAQTTAM